MSYENMDLKKFIEFNQFINNSKTLPKDSFRTNIDEYIEKLSNEDSRSCVLQLPDLYDDEDFCPRQLSCHGVNDIQYSIRQEKYTTYQLLLEYAMKIYEK